MDKRVRRVRRGAIALTFAIFLAFALFLPVPAHAASPSVTVTRVTTAGKRIALTFDFGSDAANVPAILRILAANGVRSTFFATGAAASRYPDHLRSILSGGHEIGNHSWSHPDFTTLSATRMKDELLRTENAIRTATGQAPRKLFRPPYGAWNQTVLQAIGDAGYPHTILWSIDTVDWKGISAAEIRQRVTSRAAAGAIVLMHVGAGAAHTPEALPGIISSLRSLGYELVTVSQLLGQSGATPGTTIRYTVRAGDTLYAIARRYGVTVQSIVTANQIINPNLISIGQVLLIPAGGTVPLPTPTPPAGGTSLRHTVVAGETLYAIARRYGVSVQSIVTANRIINPNLIYIGQVLVIIR